MTTITKNQNEPAAVGRPLRLTEVKKFATLRPGVNEREILSFFKTFEYGVDYDTALKTVTETSKKRLWSLATTDAAKRALRRAYGVGSKNETMYRGVMEELAGKNAIDDMILAIVSQNPGIKQAELFRHVDEHLAYQTFVKHIHNISESGRLRIDKMNKNSVRLFSV